MLTKEQIFQILEEIKQDERVQGILLAGSYSYGTPNEQSDLDIMMVTTGANWSDTKSYQYGTRLQAYYNPPDIIRQYFERKRNAGDGSTIHAWSYGEIVYDPCGIVAKLQQEARQLWKLGSPTGKWKPRVKYPDSDIVTRKEKEIVF